MESLDTLLDSFLATAANRPTELSMAHAKGTKIIEYQGNFVPEEIIYAAGALPYPLWRGGEPDPPDAVLDETVRFLNPLARSVAGFYFLGVDPITPIADMVACSLTDAHMFRISELLELRNLPICKVGVTPEWQQPEDFEYYFNKVKDFKERVEKLTGNEVTDEKLQECIGRTNEINALLRKIDNFRKLPNPPISGLQFIKINHCTALCDPEVAIDYLKRIVAALETVEPMPNGEDRPRIIVEGRAVAVGDYVVMKALEDCGCVIVNEFVDEAYRFYKQDTPLDEDPLTALCRVRYLMKPPTTNFQPAWQFRADYLLELIKDYRVDGVVWYELLYDELHDMEFATLAKRLDKEDVPITRIQTSYEYTREAMGPLITKIETMTSALRERKHHAN